ncbi:hypothetical protein ACU686_45395 [Yinghuangia aomiensis]
MLQLEPMCPLCAEREDRADTVVPELREVLAEQRELTADAPAFNRTARRFHRSAGGSTAAARRWHWSSADSNTSGSAHEEEWIRDASAAGTSPRGGLRRGPGRPQRSPSRRSPPATPALGVPHRGQTLGCHAALHRPGGRRAARAVPVVR